MLSEVEELQKEAVEGILKALSRQTEVTFKAPTGSGKTHMMADLMNRVLSEDPKAVFLVSTLSKGGLAEQNFEKFEEYGKEFPKLSPCLISSEDLVEEARPFIPSGFNVYVLGRDSYKQKGSKLTQVFPTFLREERKKGHRLYLIKDECHQATNNLDKLSSFFSKTVNFSATPKQTPDVALDARQAEECCLIKALTGPWEGSLEEALDELERVKKRYARQAETDPNFGKPVRPCLIVQISNKDKAEEELEEVKDALSKHPLLLWALIMDKDKDCDTNNAILKKLPPSRWDEELKKDDSLASVDIIIFKMVITEGWDIPRACMLYQIRDTKSKILDEQVLGRIRRNPKLLNFEELDKKSQALVTESWVWGLKPPDARGKEKVRLAGKEVQRDLKLKTTSLPYIQALPFSGFNLKKLIEEEPDFKEAQSIFSLYRASKKAPDPVQDLEKDFVKDVPAWYGFCYHLPSICEKTREALDDPSNLKVEEEEVSFPEESYYLENEDRDSNKTAPGWIWKREDKGTRFSFDSQAECAWFDILKGLAEDGRVKETKASDLFGQEDVYLLGKNFKPNSKISYAYTMEGEAVLRSFPDFVMEGRDGTAYIFEVKSMLEAKNQNILDPEAYKKKVEALKKWYKAASERIEGQVFCIPVLNRDNEWQIYTYEGGKALGGEKGYLTRGEFKTDLKKRNGEE